MCDGPAGKLREIPQPGIIYSAEEAAAFLRWPVGGLKQAAYGKRIPHRRVSREIGFSADDIHAIIAGAFVKPVPDDPVPPVRRHRRGNAAPVPQRAANGPPLRARYTARIKV